MGLCRAAPILCKSIPCRSNIFSLLSNKSTITILFMGHHEKTWLDNYSLSEVVFYRRYVDDTFCLFNNEKDAVLFFDYLNTITIEIWTLPDNIYTMASQFPAGIMFLPLTGPFLAFHNQQSFCRQQSVYIR